MVRRRVFHQPGILLMPANADNIDALAGDVLQEIADELLEVLRRDARFRTGELQASYYVEVVPGGYGYETSFEIGNTADYADIVHARYGNKYGEDPIAAALAEVLG